MKWERTITVIGCHVGGEDNHVIVGGVLPPPGATMFDKKRYLETQGDELRRWLLHEPRGKPSLCVNLVTPPTRSDCDVGMIIMESTDYPPMSGSNTICTVTVLLETGMLPMREPVTTLTLDTPAGPVPVEARCRDGKVERVQFTNVPCFATHLGATLEVEGLGTIQVDVAYGGAFFAIVDAPSLGFAVQPKEARDLVVLGNRITAAAARQLPVRHPDNADIHTVTFTEFAMPFDRGGEREPQRGDRRPRPHRPQSLRHRHLRPPGRAARARAAGGRAGVRARVDHRLAVRGRHRRRGDGGGAIGYRPDDRGAGVDHRRLPARLRSGRSIPRRLHAARHVGRVRPHTCY